MNQTTQDNHCLHLEVVTAEGSLFSGEVGCLQVTASEGDMQVYPKHARLLTGLLPGILQISHPSGRVEIVYTSGGLMEVQPDRVTIMADTAVRGAELDEAQVLEAKRQAEQQVVASSLDEWQSPESEDALKRALAKLRAIRLTHRLEERYQSSQKKSRRTNNNF